MFYLLQVPTANPGFQDMADVEGRNNLGPKSPSSLGQEPGDNTLRGCLSWPIPLPNLKYKFRKASGEKEGMERVIRGGKGKPDKPWKPGGSTGVSRGMVCMWEGGR